MIYHLLYFIVGNFIFQPNTRKADAFFDEILYIIRRNDKLVKKSLGVC